MTNGINKSSKTTSGYKKIPCYRTSHTWVTSIWILTVRKNFPNEDTKGPPA